MSQSMYNSLYFPGSKISNFMVLLNTKTMTLQLCGVVCQELQANQTDAERRQEIALSYWATLTGQILLTLPLSDVQNVHRLKGTKEERWYFPTENFLLIEGISFSGKLVGSTKKIRLFFWQKCINIKLTAWKKNQSATVQLFCIKPIVSKSFLKFLILPLTQFTRQVWFGLALGGCRWKPGATGRPTNGFQTIILR